MPNKRLLIILLPGTVFLLLLAVLVSKLHQPKSASTENTAPAPTAIPTQPTSTNNSPMQDLINNISNVQIPDPGYVAPNFDRHISLPAEK